MIKKKKRESQKQQMYETSYEFHDQAKNRWDEMFVLPQ